MPSVVWGSLKEGRHAHAGAKSIGGIGSEIRADTAVPNQANTNQRRASPSAGHTVGLAGHMSPGANR